MSEDVPPYGDPRAVVVHNHIKHNSNTANGINGFRSWCELPSDKLERCDCGWHGDEPTHYRIKARYQQS